jgi:ankyrin repeat protein
VRRACLAGDVETIRTLLVAGEVVDLLKRWGNAYTYRLACRHIEAARMLLARGADLLIVGFMGLNALHYAAYGGGSYLHQFRARE